MVGSSSSRILGFSSSSRVSATRRFSPPERLVDFAIARRAAQGVHRDLELVVERPAVDRVDLLLQLAHFGHQRVEVAAFGRVAEHHADRVEAVHHVGDRAHRQHDILLDRLGLVEMRLLLEIADRRALGRPGLAENSVSRPAMIFIRVDLPEPLGPTMPILASG